MRLTFLLMFECVNGHGNMMYIDDIVISGTPTVSVPEFVTYDAFSVYPNPSDGNITIDINNEIHSGVF